MGVDPLLHNRSYQGFAASHLLWEGTLFELKQYDALPELPYGTALRDIPTQLRLGHQIEFIYGQYLSHSPQHDVLAEAIQIIDNKKTLGELDFIIRDRIHQSITHIELAYKYYLIDNVGADFYTSLIGPNRRDSFLEKVAKIKNKQHPLLHTEACQSYLAELNLDANDIDQRVVFYAHLFAPYGKEISVPEEISRSCIVGTWMSMNDFKELEMTKNKYCIVPKRSWYHIPHVEVSWSSYGEISVALETFMHTASSPLLWVRNEDGQLSRLFVTYWSQGI